jgi:hypothetical protein
MSFFMRRAPTKSYSIVYVPTAEQIFYANHPAASNPGRVGINDLSNEMLISIIRWVSINNNNGRRLAGSLANVALCSRRFNALAEPILYEELKETSYESIDAVYAYLCLKKLSERPDLARSVKRLSSTYLRRGPTSL